jgi:CRISPR type IV-associated protein Csf1
MITASMIFDKERYETGNEVCFYCGALCNEKFTTKEFVKPTFTGYDQVIRPSSKYVCGGCASSFNESQDIPLPEGVINGRVRQWCWLLTKTDKKAFSKKHLHLIREIILNPPEPPFSLILTDGGQKHFVYKGKVNLSKQIFTVSLDDMLAIVTPETFKESLELILPLVAIVGKIAMADGGISLNVYDRLIEMYDESKTCIQRNTY